MAEAVIANIGLKDLNAKRLFAVLLLNVAAFYLVERSAAVTVGGMAALVTGWASAWPAGIGATLTAILNGQVSSLTKARMVFLRWHFPYPGCRAFTEHGPNDMAVDMAALEGRYGSLPTDPKAQNVLWYRIYNAVIDRPGVVQAHRHFLFARDYSFMSIVMFLLLGGAGALMMPLKTFLIYVLLLMVQWALATNAAKIGGHRLVTIVLAQNAASH